MRTPMNDLLAFDFPVFAFSHCRDVVAAVTNAGGFGCLGAVAHTPEALEFDLGWIESELRPGGQYGVDLLMPSKYAGAGEGGLAREDMRSRIPPEHWAFLDELLAKYDVPPLPEEGPGEKVKRAGLQVDPKAMAPLVDIAMAHQTKALVSALGTPPAWLVEKAHAQNIVVGALAGTVKHALAHAAAGVDFVIAQGTEAGGHTGDISTLVLVPQIVDAVAPLPVLAAGGIANGRQVAASLALGAAGVWCGSIWLGTEEGESSDAERAKFLQASSADTVRTRSFTGKPCRVLRSDWTDAWESDSAPPVLPMPLQSMLVARSRRRIERVAHRADSPANQLLSPFIGQVVGMIEQVKPTRRVIAEMIEEFVEAIERIEGFLADESPDAS